MTKPRILILTRQYGGVGYYRQRIPARILERSGKFDVTHFDGERFDRALQPNYIAWLEQHVGKFDLVWVDRFTDLDHLKFFRGFAHNSPGCRLVVDLDDDFWHVPKGNPAYQAYRPGQPAYEASKASLLFSEMLTVSTPYLGELAESRAHAVKVLPNVIDPADWTGHPVNPEALNDPALRIVYSGAGGHYEDLDLISQAMSELLHEQPVPFRFFAVGSGPIWVHDLAKKMPDRVFVLGWHPFHDYLPSFSWGRFDISLAPLADNIFNRSKSNIRWIESATVGIPTIVSDVGPFKPLSDDLTLKVKSNKPKDWKAAITDLLLDAERRQQIAAAARQAVLDDWTLDSNPRLWYDFVEEALSRPRIESLEDAQLPR